MPRPLSRSPNQVLSITPKAITSGLEEQNFEGYGDTTRLGVRGSDGDVHSLPRSGGQSVDFPMIEDAPNATEAASDRTYHSLSPTDRRGIESPMVADTPTAVDASQEHEGHSLSSTIENKVEPQEPYRS